MASIHELPTAVTEAFMLLQIEAMAPFATFNGDNGTQSTTTLNYKYSDALLNKYEGTGQDSTVPTGVEDRTNPPRLRYFGIGTNGVYTTDEGLFIRHPKPTDGDLQNPVPLKVVPLDEEATRVGTGELADYRMRVEINGFACYFLKVIDWLPEGDTASNGIELVSISPGEPSVGAQLSTVLEPTASEEGGDVDQVIATIQGISSYSNAELSAGLDLMGTNAEDATVPFRHPFETALLITELGFYTGVDVDQSITPPGGGTAFSITDAGYVQLALRKCFAGVDMSQEGRIEEGRAILEAGRAALL